MDESRILYWDSDVFLSYVGAHPVRITTIEPLLQEIQDDDAALIVTSVIAKVEVAYAAQEKTQQALDPQVEADIDALWEDPSVVQLIELSDNIARRARSLIRRAMEQGWALRGNDAIHLASAEWHPGVSEFHTYDSQLWKYDELIGCEIREPWVRQQRFPV